MSVPMKRNRTASLMDEGRDAQRGALSGIFENMTPLFDWKLL